MNNGHSFKSIPKPREVSQSNQKNISVPIKGAENKNDKLVFSFELFDREEKLFNLGDSISQPQVVEGEWFLSLLDCLKDVSNKKIYDLKTDIHDLHPVNWKNANINCPGGCEQLEFWQFRINKSKGRVIGIKIDNHFYIMWLDKHHNLTDSDGYGKAVYNYKPLTDYEKLVEENLLYKNQLKIAQDEIATYEQVLNEV
jgi:hypothetical protein